MEAQLAALRAEPEKAGIFLDFDGTLSEIVRIPSDARPIAGAREVLEELGRKYALVAIISGRSAQELLTWLGDGIEIWGVHGAETVSGGVVHLSPRAEPHRELMHTVCEEARARVGALGIEGLLVEDKTVMVGLHFRAAPDQEAARRLLDEIAAGLAGEYGLRRAGGRLAFELRPPEDFSKGSVVLDRARQEGLSAALFVGDDRVDLPGFDALDALASEGMTTVRVAVASGEAPKELLDRADIVVDGPTGALELLQRLLS